MTLCMSKLKTIFLWLLVAVATVIYLALMLLSPSVCLANTAASPSPTPTTEVVAPEVMTSEDTALAKLWLERGATYRSRAIYWHKVSLRYIRYLPSAKPIPLRTLIVPTISQGPAVCESWALNWKSQAVKQRAFAMTLKRRIYSPSGTGAARWLPLCRVHFPSETIARQAAYVISKESAGNRFAVSSTGARGLFQMMPFWWNGSSAYHWKFDPFNANLNTYYASQLYKRSGGWRVHWTWYNGGTL